jgi:hypothetical protein
MSPWSKASKDSQGFVSALSLTWVWWIVESESRNDLRMTLLRVACGGGKKFT